MREIEIECTPVFEFIYDNYNEYKDTVDKIIFVLEGSSGSSKTSSIIQFLTIYAQENRQKTIRCGRSKMTWTIDTIWTDWRNYLDKVGYIYQKNETKHNTKLFNNTFHFIGADDPQKFHGPRQDVFWFNEAMELDQASFNQVNQRTNELAFLDYNPSALRHWMFDSVTSNMKPLPSGRGSYKIVKTKDDDGNIIKTAYFFDKSTFRDNPFLPAGQKQTILSYNPYHPDDMHLEEDERREHPTNVINGTADKYMWSVYGEGERAQDEATIYKRWETYTDDPEQYDEIYYGLDFGFSNDPTAIVKVIRSGKRVYARELMYKTGLTNDLIADELNSMEIDWGDNYLICDSAEMKSIVELRGFEIPAIGAIKGGGSVRFGINKVKSYKLFIHKNSLNLQNELKTYKWAKEKDGTILNKPVDKNNHLLDALRYSLTRF